MGDTRGRPRRLKVCTDGDLVDRDGNVVARLTSVTLELVEPPGGGVRGAVGEGKDSGPSQGTEGGVGGTTLSPSPSPFVEQAWARWVAKREPKRTDLDAGNARLLRRAENEGYTLEDLELAIAGLLASDWHRERKLLRLSSIFATRPGGPTFRDQVETWIDRGRDTRGNAAAPAGGVIEGAIEAAKDMVRQTWGRRDDYGRQMREKAIEDLERYGINVVDDQGRPKFQRWPA